ncbi:MAG: hypothetical protein MUE53_06320 [Chitinophagales bacterium]|jgi:hypothetical protein|nr:hypothetical protein [Chitinophagales bacterium]
MIFWNWLKDIKSNHLGLFLSILLFITTQIYFTIKGVERYPFIHYGMYSGYFAAQDSFEVLEIPENQRVTDFQRDYVLRIIQTHNASDPNQKLIEEKFSNSKIKNYLFERIVQKNKSGDEVSEYLERLLVEKSHKIQVNKISKNQIIRRLNEN